jgi:hypothetical protein
MLVYLIRNEEHKYKIGVTSRAVTKRLKELQTASPSKLEVLYTYETENAFKIEKHLHNRYSYCKINNEWFDLDFNDALLFKFMCEKIDSAFIFIENNKI